MGLGNWYGICICLFKVTVRIVGDLGLDYGRLWVVVGGCVWLWVVVGGCGWLWVVVSGCGWL